jgi:hypothetical protein
MRKRMTAGGIKKNLHMLRFGHSAAAGGRPLVTSQPRPPDRWSLATRRPMVALAGCGLTLGPV